MADTFGLKIGLEGEKEFKKALTEINQSFKVLGSEMKLVESQFSKNDKSVESLAARNQVLNKEIEAQKQKIETLKSALANAAESFGENDRRTQAWQIQLNNAQAALNGMERELADNEAAMDALGKEMDDTGESADDLSEDIDDAGDAADDSEGKFSKLGGTLKTVGVAMGAVVAAAATAAVALGKSVIEAYGEYEQLVGGVDTLFKDSSQQLQDYANNAYRKKNTGQAPMYYVEGTHPAIIDKEMFDMAQNEIERRKEAKEQTVGNGKYSSKYPFSGLLVCGECGHKLRRHVRRVGSGKTVPAWGCCNRITNGREACDSHHVNEETLQRTYLAAITDMIEDAEKIMAAVRESAGLVMQPENKENLNRIEQEIIEVQEAVLAMHKAKQSCSVSATDYTTQIQAYSQRMQKLEVQQEEQKSIGTRYAEVKMWLDTFEKHISDGSIMDADNGTILKQLVEQIIVETSGIEIRFKCGVSIEKDYE